MIARLLLLLVAACNGVLGLERVQDRNDVDAGPDAYVNPIVRVGTFVQRINAGANVPSDTVMVQALVAGDTVLLYVGCQSGTAPSFVMVNENARAWNFKQLGVIAGSTSTRLWGASFWATAPDTAATTLVVTWGTTCGSLVELGDEFTHAVVDLHAETSSGTPGPCAITVSTLAANDAVWAACMDGSQPNDAGSGYVAGAQDGAGDVTEYKYTTDAAATTEAVTFATTDQFVVTAATLKPQ